MFSEPQINSNLDPLAVDSILPDQNTDHILLGNTISDPNSAMLGHDVDAIAPLEMMAMSSTDIAREGDISGHNASIHDIAEHQTFLDLVPHNQASHIAIKNGHWFDPSVWQNGQIPGDDADVLIPHDYRVWYGKESEARLDTLRVDGMLRFASKRDTKMLVDTFVVSPEGRLKIGKENLPIQSDKTTQIIFTSDTAIDTQNDPQQLGRGLISHGKAEIYGADKLDFVGLKRDALKGDDQLILDLPKGQSLPLGWQVGDHLVLGGTSYGFKGSNADNSRFRDEELTITAINGDHISFINNDITTGDNTVLRYDHQRPDGFEDEDLTLYLANVTRNVSFETENGENVPINHRGHVMFMHNPDVVVKNAGFYDLGRSDKSKLVDDPGTNIDGSPASGTNPRGRYALHFHRTGAENINSTPSLAEGNAVVGSPGWGIVHHDSHAVLENNVVFDVVGAGIVAEKGNEIGAWRNNLTIKTTGNGEQSIDLGNKDRIAKFDFGYEGEGYWVQGAAQVEMTDNIAISASGGGINVFGSGSERQEARDADTFPVANLPRKLQYIADGRDEIEVANVPLRRLSGFESYNSNMGIVFWQHMNNKDGVMGFDSPDGDPAHNARSLVEDFKLWNIRKDGLKLFYTTQVDFVDGLIVGGRDRMSGSGISHNVFAQNHLYRDLRIEGFKQGIQVPREGGVNESVSWLGSRLEDSYLANNGVNLSSQNSRQTGNGTFIFPDYFEIANTTFNTNSPNAAPTAKFTTRVIGGLARSFDASASFDRDVASSQKRSSEAIASYGWDFNNDGKIDQFGREADYHFDRSGLHQVSLTVWDSQGASRKLTKTINVEPKNHRNALIDGDFSAPQKSNSTVSNSTAMDEGWFNSPGVRYDSKIGNGGAAILTNGRSRSVIGQVVEDNGIRKSIQTLKFDLKNIEGNLKAKGLNNITVKLWGVDGEFNHRPYDNQDPTQVGALPMNSTKLLEQSVGGADFDWKTFNWDIDLGEGYQFLLVQIVAEQVGSEGDYVAIDNVKLV